MEGAVCSQKKHDDRTENQELPPFPTPLKSPILLRALVSIVAYVLLLALIGITYKGEISWSRRTAYLAVGALLCVPICIFHGMLTAELSRLRHRVTGTLSMAGTALLSASSATVLIYGVDRLARTGFMPNRMRDPYVLGLALLLVCVSVAQYAMARRQRWEHTLPRAEEAGSNGSAQAGNGLRVPAGMAPEMPGVHFFRRLPEALGRDVVYLKMSDHYVEVFTTAGHTVMLMRLADAVAELEGLGIRVHRSYWVASDHVERLVRRGRRRFLRLAGGHDVPVSRTYLPAVKTVLDRNATDG